MPRYHFHVINGTGETRDEDGVELPDLNAARLEALSGIRSILRDEISAGAIDFAGKIKITDAEDRHLLDIPFLTAVEVRNPSGSK